MAPSDDATNGDVHVDGVHKDAWAPSPGWSAFRIRRWPVWAAPSALVAWLSTVVVFFVGALAAGLASTAIRRSDVITWLVLAGCGAVCVEASRRIREPAGVAKDLLSAWTLPVALLLPPLYALLIPLPLTALLQWRVRRGLVYRRVYSAAAIGLATAGASVLFHHLLGVDPSRALLESGAERTTLVGLAFGCAALGSVVNVLLVAVAVRLSSPEPTWRDLLGDREDRFLDLGELCLGVVVAGCWLVTPVLAVSMLVPVLFFQRSLLHTQLQAAARTDAKTGLLNAGAWQAEAEREILRARRERHPVAILLADLDHFKDVNDAYGHLAGDHALAATVRALRDGLRSYDLLGRFGGEEFTAALPHADQAEALRIAERLRRTVAAEPILWQGTPIALSISIGIAVVGVDGDDLIDLLAAADRALYCAKAAGRNRVALAS
jgi:diguanylate cyclase (GGDEF)-like protein